MESYSWSYPLSIKLLIYCGNLTVLVNHTDTVFLPMLGASFCGEFQAKKTVDIRELRLYSKNMENPRKPSGISCEGVKSQNLWLCPRTSLFMAAPYNHHYFQKQIELYGCNKITHCCSVLTQRFSSIWKGGKVTLNLFQKPQIGPNFKLSVMSVIS